MHKSSLTKIDKTILLVNAVEHFDTALYGFLVPILSPMFFPHNDPLIALILGYSVLATSLFTRPVGAFIFGMAARRYGPLRSLSYSVIGVGITTLMIGCIPTYAAWGSMAAVALFLIRLLRGIFAAGESAIAKIYIMEGKIETAAFRTSYYYPTSSMFGTICASAAATFIIWIDPEGSLWRYFFIGGGLVSLLGYFARHQGLKHEASDSRFNAYQPKFIGRLWEQKLIVLKVALTTGLSHVTSVFPFTILNSLVPLISDISLTTMMAFNTALLIFDLILIPLIGRFLESFHTLKVLRFSSCLLVITLPILFLYMDYCISISYISIVRAIIVILGVIFLCPQHFYYKEICKNASNDSYLLVGIGNALGAAIIGKLTPVIVLWLFHVTQKLVVLGIYGSFIALLTFYTISRKP